MSKLKLELGVMLEEYAAIDGGPADERPFIDKWAKRIAALDIEPDDELESYDVLVTGDPLDGFTIEGPYPRGFLDDEGVTDSRENGGWVLPLAEPTVTPMTDSNSTKEP